VALFTAALRFHRLVPAPKSEQPPAKTASSRLATLAKSPLRVLYRKSARLITIASGMLAPTAYEVCFRLGQKIPPALRTP
jgi:hypothetical protein